MMRQTLRDRCAFATAAFCLTFFSSCGARSALAHDVERTQVVLTFARDGTFVLDVKNDPSWLKLRLESIPGPFADRVVMWVDGHEVRPDTTELVRSGALAIHRLRGRVPLDAKTLRWYYGLVADPYPLTIHRADGRIIVEDVGGDAWSGTIDLAGQFDRPARWPIYIVLLLAISGLALRFSAAGVGRSRSPSS